MMRKRSNGDGSIRKLKNGRWRGEVMDGYKDDGTKRVVNFSGSTRAEVAEKIRTYQAKRASNQLPQDSSVTFKAWADIWYADYVTEVQPSTYANYKYTLKAVNDYFGSKPINSIKPMEIKQFCASLKKKNYSLSYITKCRSILIQIFDAAEANDVTVTNPARKSKAIRELRSAEDDEEKVSKKDSFDEFELELLHKHLPDNLMGHSIRFLLGTGLRVQELLALRPGDISDDGTSVSITKAIAMVNGTPTLGPTKSEAGKRIVPIPQEYKADALYLRTHSGPVYIWTSRRESMLFDVNVFRKQYYRTITQIAGVRKLTPHCCRHTYVSLLEQKGIPMEVIARLVGHSKITTTDKYLHFSAEALSQAVSVLDHHGEGKESET